MALPRTSVPRTPNPFPHAGSVSLNDTFWLEARLERQRRPPVPWEILLLFFPPRPCVLPVPSPGDASIGLSMRVLPKKPGMVRKGLPCVLRDGTANAPAGRAIVPKGPPPRGQRSLHEASEPNYITGPTAGVRRGPERGPQPGCQKCREARGQPFGLVQPHPILSRWGRRDRRVRKRGGKAREPPETAGALACWGRRANGPVCPPTAPRGWLRPCLRSLPTVKLRERKCQQL